jgi:hypothetical protein
VKSKITREITFEEKEVETLLSLCNAAELHFKNSNTVEGNSTTVHKPFGPMEYERISEMVIQIRQRLG